MNDHMGLVPMSAEITMFYTEFTASLALAAQQERDRIIKLLEDKRHHIKCDCECDEELIDLIKGEQK